MTKFKYDDPKESVCPYCGESQQPCSNLNSMTRAYARGICARKHNNIKIHNTDSMESQ